MEAAKNLHNFGDIKLAYDRFRDLLEDPELGLSDTQLGRLVKELRVLRHVIEALHEDIPFADLRIRLWEHAAGLEKLCKTPDLYITDRDGNGLEGEEAKEYIECEIQQVNTLKTICEECGELK